jgi:hypothetical protein
MQHVGGCMRHRYAVAVVWPAERVTGGTRGFVEGMLCSRALRLQTGRWVHTVFGLLLHCTKSWLYQVVSGLSKNALSSSTAAGGGLVGVVGGPTAEGLRYLCMRIAG